MSLLHLPAGWLGGCTCASRKGNLTRGGLEERASQDSHEEGISSDVKVV